MKKQLLLFLFISSLAVIAQGQIITLKSFKSTKFDGAKLLSNGNILFAAKADNDNMQIWSTDGTTAGTKALTNFCPTSFTDVFRPYSSTSYYEGTYSDGNHYYGMIRTNCNNMSEMKIFKTDGNSISYSNQHNNNAQWYNIHDSLSVGSKFYFFNLAKEIYAYDRSNGNVTLVYGPGNPYPALNNDVRFIKRDGNDLILYFLNGNSNAKLVKFNTDNNTVSEFFDVGQYYLAKVQYNNTKPDFYHTNSGFTGYESPIITWNNETYFFISYQDQTFKTYHSLWKTDGTTAGTVEVKSFLSPGSTAGPDRGVYFTPFNGKLYFRFSDKTKSGLWSTDGTTAGTTIVKALNKDTTFHSYDNVMTNMVELNGKLYFLGSDSNTDFEVWESDGTTAGTKQNMVFISSYSGLMPKNYLYHYIYKFNNRIYFIGNMFPGNKQLISTDGTAAGTYSLGGQFSTAFASPIIKKGDDIFFVTGENSFLFHLQKVSLNTAKPLYLNSTTTTATKGQTLTLTGHDLRNAVEAYLFQHDLNSYTFAQNLVQVNDTTVTITIPSSLTMNSFKVGLRTSQGAYISKTEFTTGPVSVNEVSKENKIIISQSKDHVSITVNDKNKNYDYQLIDISGRIIENKQLNISAILEKKDYLPGVYILLVDNKAEKILIQ